MKKLLVFLCAMVLVFGVVGSANSGLTTIGTALIGANVEEFNLIYEDDSVYGGLVWLDYTNTPTTWQDQMTWAAELGSGSAWKLQVNLLPGYTTNIDWGTGWRLPIRDNSQCNLSGGWGYEGPDSNGYYDYRYGFNMINSEMGHLYYESLGNLGKYDTDGTLRLSGYGLENTHDFTHLSNGGFYWSGTEVARNPDTMAWDYLFDVGGCHNGIPKGASLLAIAVHPGTVDVVPIPGIIWLLGSGLIVFAGYKKKTRKT